MLLQSLPGPFDDVILGFSGKHVEERSVPRHPDNKVPVFRRMSRFFTLMVFCAQKAEGPASRRKLKTDPSAETIFN
jgi:hypothetical protein